MFQVDNSFKIELIYLGLKKLIESGEGHGFHNADQNHPVYKLSAAGEGAEDLEYADSPDRNHLFQMLKELSETIKKNQGTDNIWWYDFSDWQKFCKYVTKFRKNITT